MKRYHLLFSIISAFLLSITITERLQASTAKNWETYASLKPSHVPESHWDEILPRLLPADHPIKPALDAIFSDPNVNQDPLSALKAGFRLISHHGPGHCMILRHPKLKHYIVKTFLDTQSVGSEWINWLKRVKGAELIRGVINDFGYQSHFSVPKKWIYMLPTKINDPQGSTFILLCEDMDLATHPQNYNYWRHHVTYEKLKELYDIIETAGLYDSVFASNVPLMNNRKIAFIDTEWTGRWPVNYVNFNKYLTSGRLEFWKQVSGQCTK